MERSYLNLITSQIDPVHYIKIDETYYTLTFRESNKVTFIQEHKQAIIELAYDLQVDNYVGPFDVSREQVTSTQFQDLQANSKYILVAAEVIDDQDQINNFQKLSEDYNFYYFPDEYIDEIVLLKYTKKSLNLKI